MLMSLPGIYDLGMTFRFVDQRSVCAEPWLREIAGVSCSLILADTNGIDDEWGNMIGCLAYLLFLTEIWECGLDCYWVQNMSVVQEIK